MFKNNNVVITTRGHKGTIVNTEKIAEISPEFEGYFPTTLEPSETGLYEFTNNQGKNVVLQEGVDFGIKEIHTVQFEKNQKEFKSAALRLLDKDFVVLSIDVNGVIETHIVDKMHKRPNGTVVGAHIVYANA